MAFKQWLIEFLNGTPEDQKNRASTPPPVADPLEEEAAGLNFRTAIEAHQKWKARLQALINNDMSENLSVEEVSRDDRCTLGMWIHGAGKKRFGRDALFKTLEKNHAHFHACAGHVLKTALAGNKDDAQAALKAGDFARASQTIILNLAQMYNRAAEPNSKPNK